MDQKEMMERLKRDPAALQAVMQSQDGQMLLRLLGKLLPLAGELGTENSAAMQLLNALRPFLKEEKQGKIQRAARLARLIHVGKKLLADWEG